ncbi:uncharacterized protein LOC142095402 [Mixophyes fleayi]|uniref:uncharacterized protein LOC142095402 n=1 Tax=Mixophyes fleayi TaxID=3061075 RepID=UPI003F4E0A01
MAMVISLFDLVNLSIGTPEVGAVNFNALHTLLHAILKHLNIKDLKTKIPDEDRNLYKSLGDSVKVEEGQDARGADVYHQLQRKVLKMERQLEALNTLPTGPEFLGRKTVQDREATPVQDMWQMMQMKKKLEANEEGVSKTMTLIQELIHEIRDSQREVEDRLQKVTVRPENLQQLELQLRHMELNKAGQGDVDSLQRDYESIQKQVKDLEANLAKLPSSDDLNNRVHWEVLREALVKRPYSQSVPPSGHGTTPMSSKTNWLKKNASKTLPQLPPTSEAIPVQAADGHTSASSQTIVTQTEGCTPDGDITSTHPVGPLHQDTGVTPSATSLGPTHPPGSPGLGHPPSTTSGFESMQRVLQNAHSSSDQRPSLAAEFIPTSSSYHRIQEDTTESSPPSLSHPDIHNNFSIPRIPPSSSLHTSIASQHYSDTMEALCNIGTLSEECAMLFTRVEALERDKADRSDLRLLQGTTAAHTKCLPDLQEKLISLCREIEDLKEDMKMMEPLQKALGFGVKQLDHLRATIQDLEKEPKDPREKQEGKAIEELSVADKSHHLQEQHGGVLGHIQNTMSHLREECERLNKSTISVIQDQQQMQAHIDILYQSLEKLDEKKGNKRHMELDTDVKADRRSSEGKVSRMRFDATTEQLSRMIQDLLGRVSGQEQDWHRMLEKINFEMQSKLDRKELDPFKNKLESRWKEISQLLKDRPPQYESDEAAGIRKQLFSRFHCISCDRPVDMMVPGPQILAIPNIPGLPPPRSNRPYTVYELEQVRQHGRSQHVPELSDYGYMSSSRSCGGSHTLTFSHRRYARLQGNTTCTPQEEESEVGGLNVRGDMRQGEVDILGFDGHIYRGRMDARFPAIRTNDGNSKSHLKCTQSSQKSLPSWDSSTPPYRPQSAKSNGSNSVLSQTSQERPDSASLGYLHSQSDNPRRSRVSIEIRMDTTVN